VKRNQFSAFNPFSKQIKEKFPLRNEHSSSSLFLHGGATIHEKKNILKKNPHSHSLLFILHWLLRNKDALRETIGGVSWKSCMKFYLFLRKTLTSCGFTVATYLPSSSFGMISFISCSSYDLFDFSQFMENSSIY